MGNANVLISGAGIGGTTLAFWLHRNGFTPAVVEHAPAIREGGYKIDIRGAALAVVERMGRRLRTAVQGGSAMAPIHRAAKTISLDG
jgi:2-polyprenyl-6-methoxyphenol hydroxylase-like FAD-dependent oxidoreductase